MISWGEAMVPFCLRKDFSHSDPLCGLPPDLIQSTVPPLVSPTRPRPCKCCHNTVALEWEGLPNRERHSYAGTAWDTPCTKCTGRVAATQESAKHMWHESPLATGTRKTLPTPNLDNIWSHNCQPRSNKNGRSHNCKQWDL